MPTLARSTTPAASTASRSEAIWLARLQQAQAPLSQAALFGRSPTPADKAGLKHLLDCGEVVNLAKSRAFALVTRQDAAQRLSPNTLAREALLQHLGLSLKPLSLASSALARFKVPAYVRPHLRQAVIGLVAQGLVLPIKVGPTSLVLGMAGIRHHLAQLSPAMHETNDALPENAPASALPIPDPSPPPTPPMGLTESRLRRAYAQALPAGGSMVEIGAMQRQLGCGLADLHRALGELLQAGRIYLVQGEPTLLSADDRAAALNLQGTPYHCLEWCAEGAAP